MPMEFFFAIFCTSLTLNGYFMSLKSRFLAKSISVFVILLCHKFESSAINNFFSLFLIPESVSLSFTSGLKEFINSTL